jgi:hypothetical protein
MVMVFFLCIVVCARGSWFLEVSAIGSLVQHIVLWYYLGVGISIVVLDSYAIHVKYLARKNGGRGKK